MTNVEWVVRLVLIVLIRVMSLDCREVAFVNPSIRRGSQNSVSSRSRGLCWQSQGSVETRTRRVGLSPSSVPTRWVMLCGWSLFMEAAARAHRGEGTVSFRVAKRGGRQDLREVRRLNGSASMLLPDF